MIKKNSDSEKSIKDKLTIIEDEINPDRLSLKFNGEMSIYTVNSIADVLNKGFNSCSDITVDLSDVGRFDTAGLQILLIARNEAVLKKKTFQMINPAIEVKRVFKLCGEQNSFGEL